MIVLCLLSAVFLRRDQLAEGHLCCAEEMSTDVVSTGNRTSTAAISVAGCASCRRYLREIYFLPPVEMETVMGT